MNKNIKHVKTGPKRFTKKSIEPKLDYKLQRIRHFLNKDKETCGR